MGSPAGHGRVPAAGGRDAVGPPEGSDALVLRAGAERVPTATGSARRPPAECLDHGWFRTGTWRPLMATDTSPSGGRSRGANHLGADNNVYPAEVEDVLSPSIRVAEAAVRGVPSAEWGETVVAWVVAAEGPLGGRATSWPSPLGRLAPYKRPRRSDRRQPTPQRSGQGAAGRPARTRDGDPGRDGTRRGYPSEGAAGPLGPTSGRR